MKVKFLLIVTTIFSAYLAQAQPSFTYNDMPNIGDFSTLHFNSAYTHPGNLNTETGNNYTWNFTNLIFNPSFTAADTFRVKTHPVSAPYTKATLEYFHRNSAGNNLQLFHFSNDTLYMHRTGSTNQTIGFVPPVPSIKFPIAFNQQSDLVAPLYYGTLQTGRRRTVTRYDGFGTLNLPNGQSYNNVFRIKSITTDSTFSTGYKVVYTSYIWYKQGGETPILRISKTDINTSNGTIYSLFARKTATTGIPKNAAQISYLVYPNPNSGDFSINLQEQLTATVRLFDATGKLVFEKDYKNTRMANVGTGLPPGIYYLKINSEQNSFGQKIIISE